MTNSNSNVRRSMGPRRTGEGDPAGSSDPLAELTRFMEGQAEAAPRSARRTDAEEGARSEEPSRRIPRRPFPPLDEPVAENRPGEDAPAASEEEAFEPFVPPTRRIQPLADASAEPEVPPVEDEASVDRPDGRADESLAEAAPEEAAPEEEDDPFAQALMQELSSEGPLSPADRTASAASPRERPAFSFPSAKSQDAPRPTFSRATPTAPPPVRPAPASASAEPVAPTPDERPQDAATPDEDAADRVARAAPGQHPFRTVSAEELPSREDLTGPPGEAAGPAPADAGSSGFSAALDEEARSHEPEPADPAAERLQHARDHDAISSEAAGALEQLRSRLARHGPADPASGAAPATPARASGTTPSWARPATQPMPSAERPAPTGEAGSPRPDAPRPLFSRATPTAVGTPQRPSFARPQETAPAAREAAPAGPREEPTSWRSSAAAAEDPGIAARDEEPWEDEAGQGAFEPLAMDDLADIGDRTDEGEAPEEGWTLDEAALADAIAASVGGGLADDESADADDRLDEDEPLETLYAGDADQDEYGLEEGEPEEDATGPAADLEDFEFEFDLIGAEPEVTADDFRKPAERADAEGDLAEADIKPLDPDLEDPTLAPPPAFVRAAPVDRGEAAESAAPVEDKEEYEYEDEGAEEAEDEAEAPAFADRADADADDGEDDEPADEAPQQVFPVLPQRVRRAVPSFRFDRDEPAAQDRHEPESPAKGRPDDLDFELPGLGGSDPWSTWPAAPSQAVKTGTTGAAASRASDAGDRLSDALFDEDGRQPPLPRALAHRVPLGTEDWPTDPARGRSDEDDRSDEYAEDDAYTDDYYDESEPGWDDDEHALPPHSLEEMDSAHDLAEPPRRGVRRAVAAVLLLLVIGAGGYVAYGMLSGGEQVSDGPPPVIKADADGVKVMADGESAATTDGSKAFYDRVGEESAESGRLVRSREEPIDPSQTTEAGNGVSSPLLPKRVRTVVVRPDGSIIPAEELDAAAAPAPTAGLVPPAPEEPAADPQAGSIATSPTPVADTAPESVGTTDTAAATPETALPGTGETASEEAPADAGTDVADVADATAGEAGEPEQAAETPAAAEVLSPIRTSERIAPETGPAPAPRPAPSEGTRTVSTTRVTSAPSAPAQPRGPLSLVPDASGTGSAAPSAPSPTLPAPSRPVADTSPGDRVSPAVLAAQTQRTNQQASQPQTQTQTAAAAPTSAPATPASGPWAVQVSSQRSADQARAAYRQLQSRFPGVLGGREPDIQSADLGDRGTFYRVRLPAQTREAANQLCAELKSAGGDCFVGRN